MKPPADQDPVLNNIMLTRFCFVFLSPASQDPVLQNSILTQFFWYKVSFWSGSNVI